MLVIILRVKENEVRTKSKLATLKAGRLAQEALGVTASILEQCGPRLSGSEESLTAASLIKTAFEGVCDQTETQSIAIDQNALKRIFTLVTYAYLPIVLLNLLGLPYISLMISGLLCWYAFDTLGRAHPRYVWAKEKGINVHGVILPKEDVHSTIIFSAHHDSAPIEYFERKKASLPVALVVGSFLLSFFQSVVEVTQLRLFRPNVPPILLLLVGVGLLGGFYYVRSLRFYYTDTISPGAGDNLISVGILTALAQHFRSNRAKNTRIIVASFDGEELALQGSWAWYEAHSEEFEGATVLNFDAIYDPNHLVFFERDANATLPLSKELARECVHIAKAMGYDAKAESIPIFGGATDAASAARVGLTATTLSAASYSDGVYHSSDDTLSAIDPLAVEHAISIAIRLAWVIDEGREGQEIVEEVVEEENPELSFSKLSRR